MISEHLNNPWKYDTRHSFSSHPTHLFLLLTVHKPSKISQHLLNGFHASGHLMNVLVDFILALSYTSYLHLEVGEGLEEVGIKCSYGLQKRTTHLKVRWLLILWLGIVALDHSQLEFQRVLGHLDLLPHPHLIIITMLLVLMITLISLSSWQYHLTDNHPITIPSSLVGYGGLATSEKVNRICLW